MHPHSFPTRRSSDLGRRGGVEHARPPAAPVRREHAVPAGRSVIAAVDSEPGGTAGQAGFEVHLDVFEGPFDLRSEEHTSELQSHVNIVCRLLLEKKIAAITAIEKTDHGANLFIESNQTHVARSQIWRSCANHTFTQHALILKVDLDIRCRGCVFAQVFFFYLRRNHLDLHSFPTRRSSD